jgi:hypothetical protein
MAINESNVGKVWARVVLYVGRSKTIAFKSLISLGYGKVFSKRNDEIGLLQIIRQWHVFLTIRICYWLVTLQF